MIAESRQERRMPQLQNLQKTSHNKDPKDNAPRSGFREEKRNHDAPENLVQHSSQGIIDPGFQRAAVKLGCKSQRGNEKNAGKKTNTVPSKKSFNHP